MSKCATVEGSIFTASSCISLAHIKYRGNMVRSCFSPLPSFDIPQMLAVGKFLKSVLN